MKKIAFIIRDLNQKNVVSIEYHKKSFYFNLLNALQAAGNDVLCIDYEKNTRNIPEWIETKLIEFQPDLCFISNYGFGDLEDIIDCPLVYFDIDGLYNVSIPTMYRIRNRKSRCYFIVSNKKHIDAVRKTFDLNDEQIIYINLPTTEIETEDTFKKIDVLFLGTNFFNDKFSLQERLRATGSYYPLHEQINEWISDNKNNIDFNNFDITINAENRDVIETMEKHFSSIEKVRYFASLVNKGINLEIRGPGWRSASIWYYPELVSHINKSLSYDIDETKKLYNSAKIVLFFNDSEYVGGEYLRLLDALSSSACVVAQSGEKFDKIIKLCGIPTFENENELYEICKDLLSDEQKRKEIVSNTHEKLKEHFNIIDMLSKISEKLEIPFDKNAFIDALEEQKIEEKASNDLKLSAEIIVINEPEDELEIDNLNKQTSNKNKSKKRKKNKYLQKIGMFFGYDSVYNFPKKCCKILSFIVYENMEVSHDENHIFVMSLPFLRIKREEDGKKKVSSLLFYNIKRALRVVKRKLKKISDQNKKKKYLKVKHENAMNKLQNGEKLKVCLFVSRISCWTFAGLYKLMEQSDIFEPYVVVKPFMFQGIDTMIQHMNTTYNQLQSEGYRVIKTYDETTGEFLDLRETLNPDILFYTKYWLPQFHENFYIDKFLDKFNFYTSYCFDIAYHPAVMNFELNNLVDRYFMPSEIHKKMAEKVMDNKGKNVHVTGAPKLDVFFDEKYEAKDVWKPQDTHKKRIIWAPHHSDNFPGNLYQFNSFYEIADFMFDMANKYSEEVQFAFKPHPMLKPYLYKKWGKETTDSYYEKWAKLENSQLEEGEFIDLFLTSDAMILDSISFIAEYTATNKPAMFTIGKTSRVKLNDFGNINFEVLYHNGNDLKGDIDKFIKEVVIKGNDVKKEQREQFIDKYFKFPDHKSASQHIFDNIVEEIKKDIK